MRKKKIVLTMGMLFSTLSFYVSKSDTRSCKESSDDSCDILVDNIERRL
jgi:hypothetical protein